MILERGGVQNALFKIAAKQCLRLLMMLDFDAYLCVGGGGGVERFIEGSNKAIFKTLDDA